MMLAHLAWASPPALVQARRGWASCRKLAQVRREWASRLTQAHQAPGSIVAARAIAPACAE